MKTVLRSLTALPRPHLAASLAVVVLALAVLATHASGEAHHVDDAAAACLSIAAVVGATAILAGWLRTRARSPVLLGTGARLPLLPPPGPRRGIARARAGPEHLQVFRL